MTGEKNRFKTTEKLWDLDDKQLKTPKHDALVLWLMDEDNLNKIDWYDKDMFFSNEILSYHKSRPGFDEYINIEYKISDLDMDLRIFSIPISYNKFIEQLNKQKFNINEEYDSYRGEYSYDIDYDEYCEIRKLIEFGIKELIQKDYYLNKKNIIENKISTEVPLIANPRNNFIGGYADLIIETKKHIYDKPACCKTIYKPIEIIFEKEFIRVKYLLKNIRCAIKLGKKHCLIEVKPYIDSYGSVIRQIKSYMEFTNHNYTYCLFTLDTRFDKQFESQGITVLHPPENFDLDEYMKEMGLK